MTKSIGASSIETKFRLMNTAKEEFLKYGFKNASLRSICKKADMTTGALYFLFENKDDLFISIIKPVIDEMENIVKGHFEYKKCQHENHRYCSEEDDIKSALEFIDFCYDNMDIFNLIIGNQDHPYIKICLDKVISAFDEQNKFFINSFNKSDAIKVDDSTIHWISHMQINRFIYVFNHCMSREEARRQMEISIKFFRGGFLSILEF
ncbi:MAG: TetR/AcrR family transcriptional regulator [Tissierellia bacterium]|nr:TetR/AcrR family transcriptional regulator [Tissierellia bacterium]